MLVLDDVHLVVAAGEVVGIHGPSGSGKSTLLRLIAGLEQPHSGEVILAGRSVWPPGARQPQLPCPGFVMPIFQDPSASLDPRWPVWRTMTEPLVAPHRPHPPDRAGRRAIARDRLDEVRLAAVDLDARPGALSGGQCQRIAVLRALAAAPALVIADEPTARQDVITASVVGSLFRQAASTGTAFVVVSHDRRWLDAVADRTISLSVPRRGDPDG